MGNEPPKPQAPTQSPEDAQMEAILDMKMTKKNFEREAKKAEKEEKQCMEKARLAVNKGNDEGAKLYLQTAQMKKNHQMSMIRMSQKLDAVVCQMKISQGNKDMMAQINRISPYISKHAQSVPIEQMYAQMTNFEQAMDEITVQQKVMDQVLHQNDIGTDSAVDGMLNQLKTEHAQNINFALNAPQTGQFVNPNLQQQQQLGYQQQNNPNFNNNNY